MWRGLVLEQTGVAL